MNEILEAVLNSLWQAAAVAAAVWLLLKLTPRINAATRYAVWWAVLAVVVLLPVATGISWHRSGVPVRPGETAWPTL